MNTAAQSSKRLRQLWSNPEWAERQRLLISEGNARRLRDKPPKHIANGSQRGMQKSISVYLDNDTFAAVRSVAKAQGKTLAEILRTYVEWGLEEERGA